MAELLLHTYAITPSLVRNSTFRAVVSLLVHAVSHCAIAPDAHSSAPQPK